MITKFICEIGSNHNGDLLRTIRLIREAKEIGCWAVKFQYFKAGKLYAPEFKDKINQMKKWELSESFFPEIEAYCNDLNIKFICSVFDLEGINIAKDYVDILKIGSYELLNHNLIKAVAATGKPWILAVGMGTDTEIMDIIEIGNDTGNTPHILLYCNSNYPAQPLECNLLKISNLPKLIGRYLFPSSLIKYGWSDHTVEPGIIYKAIALSAEIVEFHMDLEDGKGFEYSIGHCWKPGQIEEVIRNVRIGEEACQPVDSDKNDEIRKWRMDPEDGMRPLKKYRQKLCQIRKTSEEWQRLCKIEILDPDGWDRQNFQFSWYEEAITREEFEKRLGPSIVQASISDWANIWKDIKKGE